MKPSLSPEQIAGHEAAYRERIADELCLDLARRHTSQLESLELREALRQLAILNVRTQAPLEDQRKSLRGIVLRHYEEIAAALCCVRPKRRTREQQQSYDENIQTLASGTTHAEKRWSIDLAAVANDPRYSLAQRGCAKKQLAELEKEIEKRQRGRLRNCVAAARTDEPLQSMAKPLLARWKGEGTDKLSRRVTRIIKFYLPRQSSTMPRPLLHLLAIEWLRDDKELWNFLEACLQRWDSIAGRTGAHRRSVLVHSTCRQHNHDWKWLADQLQRVDIGAIAPNSKEPFVLESRHLLAQTSSDESAKALARSKARARPLL